MLKRFAGINNLLLTIIPVVAIAGFLGISGAKLYSYGKGTASIGSSISTSIFTLIGIVVAMVIAGPSWEVGRGRQPSGGIWAVPGERDVWQHHWVVVRHDPGGVRGRSGNPRGIASTVCLDGRQVSLNRH